MKKLLIKVTIVSVILSAIMGIGLILKLIEINDVLGKILLTLLTLGVGSLLSLNSVDLLEEKFNILALISLSLLGISCIMAIVEFWAWFEWGIFTKLIIVISVFSVLFNLIVSFISKLGKSKIYYQIFTYLFMGVLDILLTMLVFDSKVANDLFWRIFVIDLIFAFVGFVLLTIFTKKPNNDGEYIKIKREEYQKLLDELESLKKEKEERKLTDKN